MRHATIGTWVLVLCILPLSGRAQQISGMFDLATADVTFNGINASDQSGYSVAAAGDVNGDGLDDILIGAKGANLGAGEIYLVYGRDGGATLTDAFDLATADVTFGGIDADDFSGVSVSSAGDINGDGIDDILIGTHWADPNGDSKAGETYLAYGRDGAETLTGAFALATVDVTFSGIDENDLSGYFISSAGDVNGDGIDDLLIGAYLADPNGISAAGEAYLVYGRTDAPGIPGDGNGDGKVDGLDYLMWAGFFGDDPAQDSPGSPENGDYNDDGTVDGLDYLVWAGNFGSGTVAAVPEPASLLMLVVAIGRRHN